MADSTSAATTAASVPDPDAIARAELFTRERFVHEGEDVADALAPGTGRRLALDAALAEIEAGAEVPSTYWRRRYSLMLGLERVLSEDEPRLADGTTLNPHQVDALSGTLTALLAEAQRDNDMPRPVAAPVLAVDEEPDEEPSDDGEIDLEVELDVDLDDDDEEARSPRTPNRRPRPTTTTVPTRSTRTSPRRSTTPTPTSASGSSTRPAPARPSPRWASSRRRAPAAS